MEGTNAPVMKESGCADASTTSTLTGSSLPLDCFPGEPAAVSSSTSFTAAWTAFTALEKGTLNVETFERMFWRYTGKLLLIDATCPTITYPTHPRTPRAMVTTTITATTFGKCPLLRRFTTGDRMKLMKVPSANKPNKSLPNFRPATMTKMPASPRIRGRRPSQWGMKDLITPNRRLRSGSEREYQWVEVFSAGRGRANGLVVMPGAPACPDDQRYIGVFCGPRGGEWHAHCRLHRDPFARRMHERALNPLNGTTVCTIPGTRSYLRSPAKSTIMTVPSFTGCGFRAFLQRGQFPSHPLPELT